MGHTTPMTAARSAAKLQLVQSPTFRKTPLTQGAFFPSAKLTDPSALRSTTGFGKKGNLSQGRSKSSGFLEMSEVRCLASDRPVKEQAGADKRKSPHEELMMRLKSRAAKQEAEANRSFLAVYRDGKQKTAQYELRLDNLIKNTSKRCEEMRIRVEDLKLEVIEAEVKLEKVNSQNAGRATEAEIHAMNAFERSQRRIQEDKREEEVQRLREETQASYAKVHRRLQNEQVELRDFKVLLREFRRIRLEKLYESLNSEIDGRKLRTCVREMIRNGAQRILQKLEAASLPLEPWMNEVIVNCCHVEIRIEEMEESLLTLRRQVLKPIKDDVQAMLKLTKKERLERLCTQGYEGLQNKEGDRPSTSNFNSDDTPTLKRRLSEGEGVEVSVIDGESFMLSPRKASDRVLQEMRAAESKITSLRRLLNDMRGNAAAIICNQIRQAEKSGEENAEAMVDWGRRMLSMLVSEEFGKTTIKKLQKSAPQARLTE